MTLTELIEICGGNDKVIFQSLDKAAIDIKWCKKYGTKITFGTDAKITQRGTDMLGLVVWLDRNLVAKAMES